MDPRCVPLPVVRLEDLGTGVGGGHEKHRDEHLFNTSVCRDDLGYLMAYEYSTTARRAGPSRFARF